MAIPKTCYLSAVSLLAGIVCLPIACRSDGKAGRAARASVACTKVCDLGVQVTDENANLGCRNHCVARVVGANRRCETLVLGWLDCMAAVTPRVEPRWATGGDETSEVRCVLERQLVERCEEACRSEGIRTSGEIKVTVSATLSTVKYELYDCGCTTCKAETGAVVFAPCQAAKLCAEHLFSCDGGVTNLRLRACADARCADDKTVETVLRQLRNGQRCTRVTTTTQTP